MGEGVGANVSKVRERINGQPYGVGRLAIVADVSRMSRAKTDCDDNGVGEGWGVWWERAIEREALTEMEEWPMGCRKEHDRMEIIRSREVMECDGGEDVDPPSWREG